MMHKREEDKNIKIDSVVNQYIKDLLLKCESKKDADLFAVHNTGDRSYLHIPYSQGRFLETYAKAMGAKRILEIGTFKGFSTAFLARVGKVVTIDEDVRYVDEAKDFWKKMGVLKKIDFRLGLALKLLKEVKGEKFDLVFIDADKENYRKYVEISMKLLRKGGSILVDNTLWRGTVADSETTDNGAKHLRAFNEWVSSKFGKDFSLVPAWDGLTVIVKH